MLKDTMSSTRALALALGALLAAGCGGHAVASDAGAPDASSDTAADASSYTGPRVRDVCSYVSQQVMPECPDKPYSYDCPQQMTDPDCVYVGPLEHDPYRDGGTGYTYDCKTLPGEACTTRGSTLRRRATR